MPTIPAAQLQADVETLEAARRRFRSRAIAAQNRGDRADAAENDELALLFGRVLGVYRNAHSCTPMTWTTRDTDDIPLAMLPTVKPTTKGWM